MDYNQWEFLVCVFILFFLGAFGLESLRIKIANPVIEYILDKMPTKLKSSENCR